MGTVRLWNLLHQNRDQGRGLCGRSHRRGGLWLELHLWSRKHRWARMDLLLVYGGTAIRKVLEWSNRKSTVWLPRKCPGRFLSDQRCLRRMRKGVGGKPRACAIRRRARELCEPISPRTPCPPENKIYPFDSTQAPQTQLRKHDLELEIEGKWREKGTYSGSNWQSKCPEHLGQGNLPALSHREPNFKFQAKKKRREKYKNGENREDRSSALPPFAMKTGSKLP